MAGPRAPGAGRVSPGPSGVPWTVQLDLEPAYVAAVLPWGPEGVLLTVVAGTGSGVRACSVVREGPWVASMFGWRRAEPWGACPVRPYGPGMHLAEALRWVYSRLSPFGSWPSLVRVALVLRRDGLREALDVMES